MLGFHKYWHSVIRHLAVNLRRQSLKWPLREIRAEKKATAYSFRTLELRKKREIFIWMGQTFYIWYNLGCISALLISLQPNSIFWVFISRFMYTKAGLCFCTPILECSRRKDTWTSTCKVSVWILKLLLANTRQYRKACVKQLIYNLFSQVKYHYF